MATVIPPLPVEGGLSLVVACRTRRELVELLASLFLETGEPEAVSYDDYAEWRWECAQVLPAAEAEWLASVPLLAILEEAARQLREGRDRDLAAVRDPRLWERAAVAGSDALVAREPAEARADRRGLLRLLARRSRSASALQAEAEASYEALLEAPPGGRELHPEFWPSDRGRDRRRNYRPS